MAGSALLSTKISGLDRVHRPGLRRVLPWSGVVWAGCLSSAATSSAARATSWAWRMGSRGSKTSRAGRCVCVGRGRGLCVVMGVVVYGAELVVLWVGSSVLVGVGRRAPVQHRVMARGMLGLVRGIHGAALYGVAGLGRDGGRRHEQALGCVAAHGQAELRRGSGSASSSSW